MPCQWTLVTSASVLCTTTRTCSRRRARRVGPRKVGRNRPSLEAQVGVDSPGRNSAEPAAAVNVKVRIPSRCTPPVSGGIRRRLAKVRMPTVLIGPAAVRSLRSQPTRPAAGTTVETGQQGSAADTAWHGMLLGSMERADHATDPPSRIPLAAGDGRGRLATYAGSGSGRGSRRIPQPIRRATVTVWPLVPRAACMGRRRFRRW